MKQLFITDLDGTLLTPESQISAESATIISDLTRKGALITVATARTPATVEPLLRDTITGAPPIVITGAAMWNRDSKEFINPHLMPDEIAENVTTICRDCGVNPMTYTIGCPGRIDMFAYGNLSPAEQAFLQERSSLPHKHINILPANHAPNFHKGTILIFAIGQIERIHAIADKLRKESTCSVSAYPDIFNKAQGYLEVFAPNVSKAAAVTQLKAQLGAEELIVFGDNLNDIPMMRVADRAIAVDNALPEVKAVAHEIIGANTSPSVAEYIANHFQP